MPGVTYKCPSCGGYLAFDPETQRWKCPFCDSEFDESGLNEKDEASAQAASYPGEGGQLVYRCPSCGSEIMTDETTVSTHCYYCHSPVVLEGKLTDEWLPDTVLPFTIDKEQAVDTFMNWVKGKRYVPNAFFSRAQVEKMSGVYYPHFVTECEVEGAVEGEGRQISVMETSNEVITSTRHYRVRREGVMTFRDILRPALKKTNRKLSDGIHPFPLEKEKPFSGSYLTGFLAERRDIDESEILPDIQNEVAGYVEPLLDDTLHYDSCSVTPSSRVTRTQSRYVLLPTWVLTYPNKKNPEDPYYYAMNGCTGEVCGKLPVDKSKLRRTGLIVFAAVLVIGCILSYFMF
ncbi:MAG: TFIIB-type zinc ribbon-containing protein [Clostridia bacterium]|nr:TFIIB-type zinc ribbon-containing protein [Clostridia bacterium]